ncbi:hypothetical protein DRO30_02850, partial [Candidatus Bathyarchaeota archaeon]
ENIIKNIIETGRIVLRNKNEARISTSNYTLGCLIEGKKIVVKTVMKTSEMSKSFRKIIRKHGMSSNLKAIVLNTSEVERWIKEFEKIEEICKICGICAKIRPVVRCNVIKMGVCIDCCLLIGGPYLKPCKSCLIGKDWWKKAYEVSKKEKAIYIL